MRLKITSGENIWLIAGESQTQDDGNYQGRLLNELKLSQSLTALGSAPVTLNISVRNDDGYISSAIDLWGATVEITTDSSATWTGTITAYDSDGDGNTYLVVTEKAAPELAIQMPDEVARLVTVDDKWHSSAVNVTLPLVFGGNSTKPHLIKGILIDKTAGIYLLCVGEIHQVVKVYRGTEEITTGFTAYTGTAGQANFAGFAYVQLTEETIRKNDDGSYAEISADVIGLKLGSSTIEECRNGARVLYYLLTTAKDGVCSWGLGIGTSEINTTAFNQAISDVDTAGLKFDGIFYFRQAAQSWIDQICLAIRGAYSIGRDGERALYINKSAASAKTYTETNMRMLRHGVGAYTGRVYNKGKLDFDYNPITGQFMQSAQYEDAVSIAAIGEQEFYGQSYLIKDMTTAQAIVEYTCKKSLIGARKVYFEADELPTGARNGTVITVTRADLGISGDYQITSLEIGDHIHTIEAEKYDTSIFSYGTPGTAIDWTKDPPIVSTANPGVASGLTLGSEIRPSQDGTNIVVLTGTFTPPAGAYIAASIEYGEGAEPTTWNGLGMVQGGSFEIAPVKPATLYAVRVQMISSTGHSDYITATQTTQGDDVAPGAPSIGVTSYLKTVTLQISLATVPSDMAGFAIYRHTANNSAASSQIGSITSKDGRATYTDEAPAYGATYYYWVKSFDTWGNPSAFSDAASTLITAISGTDIVDGALARSSLFAAGVVDATAIAAAAVTAAKTAIAAIDAATGNIVANAVGELQIAADAVTAAKLNVAGIDGTTGAIAAGAVAELQLANDAVTAAKLNVAAIDGVSGAIVANAVGELQLASNAVTAAKIKAGEVGADALAAGAVTELKLANDAVTAAKLAVAGIDGTTGAVATGAVAELQLAAAAVTAPKIADGAVTMAKLLVGKAGAALNDDPNFEDASAWRSGLGLKMGSIVDAPTGMVGTKALRNPDSWSGCVSAKLIPVDENKQYRLSVYAKAVTTASSVYLVRSFFATGAESDTDNYAVFGCAATTTWTRFATVFTVPAGKKFVRIGIHGNSVSKACEFQDFRLEEVLPATLIQDGAIITDKLAAGAVTAAKVTSGELITLTAQIKDAVVTSAKISDLSADKINAGTLAAARIAAGSLAADKITGGAIVVGGAAGDVNAGATTISGGKITTGSITATQIATDAVTADKIQAGAVTAAKVTSGELITLTAQIKDATITAAKTKDLSADKITAGTLAAARIAAGSLAADKITGGAIVVGGAAGDVNAGTTTVDGGKITADTVTASKLSVIARELVNPVSVTGHVRGWCNVQEDGSGTSSAVSYDATENALKITTSSGHGTRSQTFLIDPNKIYRIACSVKKSAAHGIVYIGACGFNAFTASSDVAGATVVGNQNLTAYSAARNVIGTGPNLYFMSAAGAASYADYVFYLIGSNRSINDVPQHLNGDNPYIQASAATKWGAIRFLNWNNTVSTSMFIKNISVTEVGAGQIVTDNIAAGAITAAKVTSGELITLEAQIKDATIASAKIKSLDAAKITTGSLDAARIAAGSITGAKIAASTITANKILIAPPGAALNDDPGCSDISVWSGGSVVSLSDGIVGSAAIRASSGLHNFMKRAIPLDRSKTYRFRLWARSDGTAPGAMYMRLYYNAGATAIDVVSPFALTATWTEHAGIIAGSAFPAGVMAVQPCVIFNYNSATGYHEIQDIRLEEVLPATLIQDGAIITDKLAVGAVKAGKIYAGAVETAALATGAVTADKITAGAIQTEKLSVLGKNLVNPVSQTGVVNGWGNVLENGEGTSTAISYDSTEGALEITVSGSYAVRCKTFLADPNKIYRVQGRVKKSATTGEWDIGVSGFTAATDGYEGTGNASGAVNFARYNSSRAALANESNVYFHYESPSPTSYVDFTFFLIGANRSITETPNYKFTGTPIAPYIKCIGSNVHCAIRLLNWANLATTTSLFIKDLTVTEVGGGEIIADNVKTGQLQSLNYSTTAGSMIDLDAGDVKMGGSSAPRFSFTNSTNTGVFAGFTFNATDLTAGSSTSAIGVSTDTAKKAFWAGNTTPASAPFSVAHDGTVRLGVFISQYAAGWGDWSFKTVGAVGNISSSVEMYNSASNGYTGIELLHSNGTESSTIRIGSGGILFQNASAVVISGFLTRIGFTADTAPSSVTVPSTEYYGYNTTGRVYAAGGFFPTSDERCKSEIENISVLEPLKTLRVKKYRLDNVKIKHLTREKEIEGNLKSWNRAVFNTALPEEPDLPDYNPNLSIGVMAADFNAAFGIGRNDKETYNLTDAVGVALRAIQELAEIVDELKSENAELRAALNLPEKLKKQTASAEFTAEEIEVVADKHVKAAYENILKEIKP